jgi:hypothetical protein
MLQSSPLNLKTWKSGAQRINHYCYYLLGAAEKKGQKEFPWLEVKEEVKDLIAQFGGSAGLNPHYFFVRLRNDGNWKLSDLYPDFKGDMKVSDLNLLNNRGSFSVDFEKQISDRST